MCTIIGNLFNRGILWFWFSVLYIDFIIGILVNAEIANRDVIYVLHHRTAILATYHTIWTIKPAMNAFQIAKFVMMIRFAINVYLAMVILLQMLPVR